MSRRPRSVAERSWEPVVATHPTDPQKVAVVYLRRGDTGATCATNPVVRISRDGGKSWRTTKSTPGRGASRGMGLHAAIAWGVGPRGKNRLYWANMTSPGCGSGRFSLTTSYSDDEGATWSRLRVERGTPPWVGGFPDIAVDRDP
ncbi:MAG TPA: sialidase family protein, partial [Candidatus Limnocylindrales bacterium]|nr:sialidase family protein [Candidatus Limnocylindrales bacterium]